MLREGAVGSQKTNSTKGQNNPSFLRSMNQSELGDWKQEDNIGLNAVPIYDVRMIKTENTIDNDVTTKEIIGGGSEIVENSTDKMNIKEASI